MKTDLFESIYGSVFKIERRIVMNKENVADVLDILNLWDVAKAGVCVGCCNWPSDEEKWFVNFAVRQHIWKEIKQRLECIDGRIFVVNKPQRFEKFEEI